MHIHVSFTGPEMITKHLIKHNNTDEEHLTEILHDILGLCLTAQLSKVTQEPLWCKNMSGTYQNFPLFGSLCDFVSASQL